MFSSELLSLSNNQILFTLLGGDWRLLPFAKCSDLNLAAKFRGFIKQKKPETICEQYCNAAYSDKTISIFYEVVAEYPLAKTLILSGSER